MTHLPIQGPTGLRFRLGSYKFQHYRVGETRAHGRWEATRHGRGVSGYRTPVGAWLALRRWVREPPRPDESMCPNCVTPWKCNGPHEETT